MKFLSEKAVFDCVHYGVLAALNQQPDRPQVQFKPAGKDAVQPREPAAPAADPRPQNSQTPFFRTMTPEEYRNFSAAVREAPKPAKEAAAAAAAAVERQRSVPLRETVMIPKAVAPQPVSPPVCCT